jgi:enoyl-CoA hydratase/carnithine racemase
MDYQQIRYTAERGIATITLDRPDHLNAFTGRMTKELIDAFDRIDSDDEVRAVIVTGAGRAFCAGADLRAEDGILDTAVHDREDATLPPRDGGGVMTLRIFRCLKPVIAAINGPAVGVGVTMTLPMDIRLASEGARFGFVFARRGIVPEAASSYFLPRVVGISRALDWCLTGRIISAAEALEAGLVRSLYPPDRLLEAAEALARDLAENCAPVSLALTRQLLWRGLGMTDPMEAHRLDSRAISSRGASRDAAEGIAAFLEKRPAVFPDKVSSDMPGYFPWWQEPSFS